MVGRAVATLLGVVGGLLVALSGLASFVGTLLREGARVSWSAVAPSLVLGIVAGVLGVVLMIVARPRIFWGSGRSLTTGILLIAIAGGTWIILGGGLLLLAGVLLALLAGLIFVVEEFTHKSFFSRLGISRRRLF
jgi:hypothetical protein